MDSTRLAEYRAALIALGEQLKQEDALGAEGQKTVTLDQQSVGRLSRQDALQQQAMAKANQTRRDQMRLRIAAALQRIDEGEYGYCTECGEDIPAGRLALDPTMPTCVNCARG
ncbi:MAG: TraR/DksA C4-type zinc finger protein [Pseudomonadota bacterium]